MRPDVVAGRLQARGAQQRMPFAFKSPQVREELGLADVLSE